MPHSAATVRLAPIIKTNHAQALALDMHMIQQLHHDTDDEQQQRDAATNGAVTATSAGFSQQQQQQQSSGQPGKPFRPLNSGQSVPTVYSSPQLTQRSALLTSSSPVLPRRTSTESASQTGTMAASPIAGPRTLHTPLGQHHSTLYTFTHTSDDGEAQSHERQQQQQPLPDTAEVEAIESMDALPSTLSSPLPSSAPLHIAVSSSAVSDDVGRDALFSPGSLYPSSSASSLSFTHSPHAALSSPSALHCTPPPLSAASASLLLDTATVADVQDSTAAAAHSPASPVGDASTPAAVTGSGLSSFSPLSFLPSPSFPSSPTSLATPLVASTSGVTARKRCQIRDGAGAGQSLLRHCLPCLPLPSTSSAPSASSSASRSAAHRRQSRLSRESRRRRASGDDGCCSNLVTCNPFRLSFRFTLVLLCILQVVVSVGIVWYLGYSNSESLIGTLSSQLRETALVEITGQIHDQMVRPMRAVNQLQYLYGRSLPNLSDLTWGLPNVTGMFADLSFVVFNYPEISGAGCTTRNNVFVGAINISAYLAAGASPAATNGVTSGFAYSIQLYNSSVAIYHYPPVPSPDTNPNWPVPDFNTTSTVAELGPVWYTVNPFVPTQRPQYVAAVAAKGDFTWSPVYQLAQATNTTASMQQNVSVIAASKAYLTSDGSVGYTCFASVFLSRLGDLLRSLSVSYGANGLALITDRHGVPLASSDNGLMLYTSKRPTWSLLQFADQRLQALAAPLAAHHLLVPANYSPPTSPTGDFQFGGVFYQNEPAFSAVPISYGGSAYHLQATVLNSTGLDWIIVVVTKDTDFDGDISHHELVVGMLSMTVLIVAIVCMVVVTQCLNRPLTLVVRYMSAVSQMGKQSGVGGGVGGDSSDEPGPPHTLSRSAEQLRQLKEIYAEWKEAVTIRVDDGSSEVSRVGSTSRSVAKEGRRESRSGTKHQQRQHVAQGHGSYASTSSGHSHAVSSSSDSTSLSDTPPPAAQSLSAWWSRLIDRSAVCLMREVEDMQFTFHSMLHQLTKSTQELEESNESKRHFVRYIFHEVRVPLNAVMLGLADLRSSCGSPGVASEWTDEQRDVLDIVHEQSQVVGRILNDVLSLHKIEDGALTLQYSPFSLESMILSTMQSFQPGIHDKQIHYTAQLQTVQQFIFTEASAEELQRLPHIDVVGDKYRLRQVLANFLSNAIKFTPTLGNVHVSLAILPASPQHSTHLLKDSTSHSSVQQTPHSSPPASARFASPATAHHAIDMPNQASAEAVTRIQPAAATTAWPVGAASSATFRISVRDTGVGVSSADQKKLFSPYMQILPGELQKGAGTGLGLSISQNLIRIHGGQIGYAVPEDGRGSEFYMEVPMEMMYRQPATTGAMGHSSTTNTSLRLMEGSDGKDGSATTTGGSEDGADGGAAAAGVTSSDLDDDGDEVAIGALPAAEDRQEEEAYIKEIADLQLQQHSRARPTNLEDNSAQSALEAPLSASSSSSSSTSLSSSTSELAHSVISTSAANPLYVSRPTLGSPDSSMRVLAQQRMHAQHLRQSAPSSIGAAVLSPSLQHSSRRLLALARQTSVPGVQDSGTTPSSARGEDSAVSSGAASVSSRSVSLVMNDAHGPAASPLLYKRSPITLTRRVGLNTHSFDSPVSTAAGTSGGSSSSALSPSTASLPAAVDESTDGMLVASDETATSTSHLSSSPSGTHPSFPSVHQQRRGLSSGLHDGLSPVNVRTNSTPVLPVISTVQSAGSSSVGGSGSGGSPNHGSPSTRSDVYITLATYGVPTKAQRPANANSGISSRARDALSALAAAEAAAHAAMPQHSPLQPTQQHSMSRADLSDETDSGSHITASPTTAISDRSASGSLSTASTSTDGCEPRLTPPSSNSHSSSNSAVAAPTDRLRAPSEQSLDVAERSLALLAATISPPSAQADSAASLPGANGGYVAGSVQQQHVHKRDVSAATTPSLASSLPSTASASPPALRVLVAEDSVPNLKLLLVLLRKCKVDAVGVENGQLAVDAFATYCQAVREAAANPSQPPPQPPFDVILMDGNMPVLSGIEATRRLRSLGVTIPIYAVTGNAMAEDTAEFLRAGATSPILTKPVQQKELHRILNMHAADVRKTWRARQQQRQQQPAVTAVPG